MLGFYRFEVARMWLEQGMRLEEAAARAGMTVESLKEWVDPARTNPMIEIYERRQNALRS